MRLLRSALLVLAALCAHATSLTIAPTTTLSAETANNTSAASSFTSSSNGNLGATNISKVDHRTLLYPGATTAIYSHLVLWFGPSNHIQVGYRSDDFNQVKKQVDDHLSRGITGTIIDWYGTSHTVDTTATQYLMQYAESLPGYPFQFALMEDKGALLTCSGTPGCDINAKLIDDLTYIVDTFAGSPTYLKSAGRPVIMFFGLEAYAIDWDYVKASVPGNPLFIFQNAGAFTQTASDGGFAWVQINTSNTYDWKQSYLNYFYQYGQSFPQQHTFGAVYKGFNDTMASWSLNRIMSQQCGQVWLNTWDEIARHYNASNQLEALQIVTWNDYEEGTAIESGIDNCLSLDASVSGTTLSWNVSGNENTLDHYTVFISTDGENLMSLAEVSPGLHSLDLAQFGLGRGMYTLYVKAVGKPSIANHMSPAAYFTVGDPSSIVLNVSPDTGIAPLTVTATADCSTVSSTIIDFGEGSPVRSSSASHTYTVPGTYTISATVTDANGLTGSTTQTITISPNQPPSVLLTVTPGSGLAGTPFTASTANSFDADDAVASSTIDFGDGSVSSGFTSSHMYSKGGTYTITGVVTDMRGAQSVAATTVTVADFALAVRAQNGSVSPSQPATFLITVTPSPELRDPVTLACSGMPAGYTCAFSSSVLAPTSGPATATLSVSAVAATASNVRHLPLFALCFPLLGLIPAAPSGRSKRRMSLFGLSLSIAALLLLTSCGGGSSQPGNNPQPSVPGKTLSLTITGTTGPLQRSVATSVFLP